MVLGGPWRQGRIFEISQYFFSQIGFEEIFSGCENFYTLLVRGGGEDVGERALSGAAERDTRRGGEQKERAAAGRAWNFNT